MTFECLRCGKCCSELGQDRMIVSSWDIGRWIQEERWDILKHVTQCIQGTWVGKKSCFDIIQANGYVQCSNCHSGGGIINVEELMSGKCLFLKKKEAIFECSIQETKPDHCNRWEVGKYTYCQARLHKL